MTARERFDAAARAQRLKREAEEKVARRMAKRSPNSAGKGVQKHSYRPNINRTIEFFCLDSKEVVGFSPYTMRKLFEDGRVAGRKDGRFLIVDIDSVMNYKKRMETEKSERGRKYAEKAKEWLEKKNAGSKDKGTV